MDTPSSEKLSILHFIVENTHLCIEISYLEKILPLVELEIVPNSPHYLAGLMNLAGKSIPVIDLALRLSLPRSQNNNLATPILLCSDNKRSVGLIVKEIIGLAMIDINSLQMDKDFAEKNSFFKAAVTLETDLTLLLNMERILTSTMVTTPVTPTNSKLNLFGESP